MAKDLSGQQTGVASGNGLNNPRTAHYRGRNEFPQSYPHATTERYGEFSPFFHVKCERGDVQNLQPMHDLHTYTMKSPNTLQLRLHKTYMKCPMEAIYPRNWDKMLPIPVQGDDVPSDTRALLNVSALVDKLIDLAFGGSYISPAAFIRCVLLLESITSYGSLFYKFNMHLSYRFSYLDDVMSFDKWFDTVFVPTLEIYGKEYPIYINGLDASSFEYRIRASSEDKSKPYIKYVSTRRFLELIRQNDFEFGDFGVDWENFVAEVQANTLNIHEGYNSVSRDELNPSKRFLNIEPIIAYQLCCAQFGTNDHIDFIFSAQLYRDNMQAFASSAFSQNSYPLVPTYMRNGLAYQYDVFSQKYFDTLIDVLDTVPAQSFFLNLFQYNPSLRYGDYFTGGRAQPLAVGEYNIPVTGEGVSVIETVRKIQLERLLHHANLTGPKMSDFLAGIYGGPLPQAPKDVPIFLTLQDFNISGFETNNTGSEQFAPDKPNNITMNLRSTESAFAFDVEIAEPCWIIGLDYFDAQRLYSKTMDRFAFHHDRYDDFIPELQYIGDQDIKAVELDALRDDDLPFAYALRNMEYKQRYGYVSGGFIENLPSWEFVTDNEDGNPPATSIDPDYIRSSSTEFDRFYKSLNGYSLGSYFHFIIKHTNITSPLRMMDVTPEILN